MFCIVEILQLLSKSISSLILKLLCDLRPKQGCELLIVERLESVLDHRNCIVKLHLVLEFQILVTSYNTSWLFEMMVLHLIWLRSVWTCIGSVKVVELYLMKLHKVMLNLVTCVLEFVRICRLSFGWFGICVEQDLEPWQGVQCIPCWQCIFINFDCFADDVFNCVDDFIITEL